MLDYFWSVALMRIINKKTIRPIDSHTYRHIRNRFSKVTSEERFNDKGASQDHRVLNSIQDERRSNE